jgi:DNA gyrase subunit A
VARLSDKGGDLVGALTVDEDDEVLVIFEKGNIVRSRVDEVRLTGRNTMGVQFAKANKDDAIVAVARNPEREVEEAVEAVEAAAEQAGAGADGDAADGDDAGVSGSVAAPGEGDDGVSVLDPSAADVAETATDAVPSKATDDHAGGDE